MLYLLGAAAGAMMSVQTAVNSRLRSYVKTPFLSAMWSCLSSLILLLIMLLLTGGMALLTKDNFAGSSWWMFTGGFLGAFVLVGCIALFPILGAVQTTILPIFGQILLGILADSFGWFGYEKKIMSAAAAVGIGILIAGIICAVVLPDMKGASEKAAAGKNRLPWQCMGILAGMASAAQSAVNGRLGAVTGSSLLASCISVVTVCLVVFLINLRKGHFKSLRQLAGPKPPWWSLAGGLFGVGVVWSNAHAAPVIGTGMLMIFSVFGQLLFSILIQHFGWLGSGRKRIRPVQGAGLVLIFAGVVMAKML